MCLILILLPPRVYFASETCVPDGKCRGRLVVKTNFTWLIPMRSSLCLRYHAVCFQGQTSITHTTLQSLGLWDHL